MDGAVELAVASLCDVLAVVAHGNAVRATAGHKLNASSSRSHAILTLTLEQRARPGAAAALPPEARLLRSKLRLVDLAGAERAKATGTSGARFSEGVAINRGLLELGNVINALSEGAGRHVPYRCAATRGVARIARPCVPCLQPLADVRATSAAAPLLCMQELQADAAAAGLARRQQRNAVPGMRQPC